MATTNPERTARGRSLADRAVRTGIAPPNLPHLEIGKHAPSLETLGQVSQALALRVAKLPAV